MPTIFSTLKRTALIRLAATDEMLENRLLPARLVRRHGEGFWGELQL